MHAFACLGNRDIGCGAITRGAAAASEVFGDQRVSINPSVTVDGILFFIYLFFHHHLSPMGPINELQRCPSRVWSQGIYPSLPGPHAYEFFSRCRYSTPTPHQPMIELFVLMSSSIPLRKSEKQCTPAETRNHKFRLSGRALYPLDDGGSP